MNTTNIIELTKKIQSIKKQQNKGISNIKSVRCKFSKTKIYFANAVCLNVANNNTAYISSEYLYHTIFNDLDISKSFKIDLLTLVYLGATITNANNNQTFTINEQNEQPTYIITLKNNIDVIIYDNDAKAKKYFNILKNYKNSIACIHAYTLTPFKIYEYVINSSDAIKTFYPPYTKKCYDYQRGIGYNPNSKNDCIMYW